jgi:F0F1-type ATP synthase membrane subunit b/b'
MYFLSGTPEALQLNLSVFVVMAVFLVFHFIMNRLLYRPLLKTLHERDKRTAGTLEFAGKTEEEYQAMLERYERTVKAARQEGYAVVDRLRREAQARQAGRLKDVQEEMRREVDTVKGDILSSAAAMQQSLQAEISTYAGMILAQVLHREGPR